MMSDYDEGYRAGMQKMREVGQRRIEELEAKLANAVEVVEVIASTDHEMEDMLDEVFRKVLGEKW
jgi:flagellar biosynthesis/type III secretory pathway protein FliH